LSFFFSVFSASGSDRQVFSNVCLRNVCLGDADSAATPRGQVPEGEVHGRGQIHRAPGIYSVC
jgi:hypothetical protein